MSDNFRVLDVSVAELQANLNAQTEPWLILQWDFYSKGEERRVTMVMMRSQLPTVNLQQGFDPRILRRN